MSAAKRRMLCCACLWLIANGQLMIADSRAVLAENPQMEIWWADPLFEKKDPEQAKRLADSLVRSFEDYERNCSVFRAARIKLLNSFF